MRGRGGEGALSVYVGKKKSSWVGTWRVYDAFGRGKKRAKVIGSVGEMSKADARKKLREIALAESKPKTLEVRVREWVESRIGKRHMDRRERAMRLLEEAIELAQAEGITREMVDNQAAHVYARPVGEPSQEAAGVAVCLLGWCAATGNMLATLAEREVRRIEAKPVAEIRGSVARKADADLVCSVRTLSEVNEKPSVEGS